MIPDEEEPLLRDLDSRLPTANDVTTIRVFEPHRMLAANLVGDLDAWVRLLGLHDIDDLAAAEPDTMRFRLYHLPARLADHARRRRLRIEATWPWATAFTTCWQRLASLPAIT